MSKEKGYFIFSLAVLILGTLIPHDLLDLYLPEANWEYKVSAVMHTSMMVIVAWIFRQIGRNNATLEKWATDTFIGVVLMVVTYFFLIRTTVNIFLEIPVHGFILLLFSLEVAVLASILFFGFDEIKVKISVGRESN